MRYQLSSLLLLSTAIAVVVAGGVFTVQQLGNGNATARLFAFSALAIGIAGGPFIGIMYGNFVSVRIGFESHIPGIAAGCFLGFFLSFATLLSLPFLD